jgi:mRNA interferase MazF
MVKPIVGDVVVVPFPFSDLTEAKRRPALVVADLDGDDLILCMITSRLVRDRYSVELEGEDFESGGLPVASNIRPSRLFTADTSLIIRVEGKVRSELLEQVRQALLSVFGLHLEL